MSRQRGRDGSRWSESTTSSTSERCRGMLQSYVSAVAFLQRDRNTREEISFFDRPMKKVEPRTCLLLELERFPRIVGPLQHNGIIISTIDYLQLEPHQMNPHTPDRIP